MIISALISMCVVSPVTAKPQSQQERAQTAKDSQQMRRIMLTSDRVKVIVGGMFLDEYNQVNEMTKQVATLRASQLKPIIYRFKFSKIRGRNSGGGGDDISLYFEFYKGSKEMARFAVDYNGTDPRGHGYLLRQDGTRSSYFLDPKTIYRIRSFVINKKVLRNALIEYQAEPENLHPNWAFKSVED